jgi:hypothetical protein
MQPQLFIEGNHRTGSLIASLELLRAGEPPFVLNRDNAIAYFNPSTVIKFSDRRHYNVSLFKIPGIKKRFGKFLRSNARPNYLLAPPPQPAPPDTPAPQETEVSASVQPDSRL